MGLFLRPKAVRISNNSHYMQTDQQTPPSLRSEPQTGGKCVCWVYVYKIGINGGQRISHHLPPNKILPHPTNISISQGLRHFTSPSYLNCLNGKGVRQKCLLSYFTHHHPRTMECLSSALMTTLFNILNWIWWWWFIYLCHRPAQRLGIRHEEKMQLRSFFLLSSVGLLTFNNISYLVEQDNILQNVNVNVIWAYESRLWMNIRIYQLSWSLPLLILWEKYLYWIILLWRVMKSLLISSYLSSFQHS